MRAPLFLAIASFVTCLAAAKMASADEERDVQFHLLTKSTNDADAKPLDACGGDAAIELAVEERLHRRVFVAPVLADDTLSITFDEARATIVEIDRAGTELGRREVPLPPNDCAKALETVAVVLAIMIGPERKTTAPPPVPEPPSPTPEEPPAPPQKRKAVPPPKTAERTAHWTAAPLAEVVVGTGVLPGVAWAVMAGAVVGTPVRRIHLIGRVEYWPIQYTPTRPTAEVTRYGGAVLGCGELVRGEAAGLSLCGGFDAGRLGTESSSFTRTSNATLVLGVLAEARFGYRFSGRGPFVVEPILAAQIAAIVRRDRFTYRDEAGRELTLLRPAPLSIQAGIGVAVHFF